MTLVSEERIQEIVRLSEPSSTVEWARIEAAVRAGIRAAGEAAAKLIAENRLLGGSIGPLFTGGWHQANEAGAEAIRERL